MQKWFAKEKDGSKILLKNGFLEPKKNAKNKKMEELKSENLFEE